MRLLLRTDRGPHLFATASPFQPLLDRSAGGGHVGREPGRRGPGRVRRGPCTRADRRPGAELRHRHLDRQLVPGRRRRRDRGNGDRERDALRAAVPADRHPRAQHGRPRRGPRDRDPQRADGDQQRRCRRRRVAPARRERRARPVHLVGAGRDPPPGPGGGGGDRPGGVRGDQHGRDHPDADHGDADDASDRGFRHHTSAAGHRPPAAARDGRRRPAATRSARPHGRRRALRRLRNNPA